MSKYHETQVKNIAHVKKKKELSTVPGIVIIQEMRASSNGRSSKRWKRRKGIEMYIRSSGREI